MSEIDLKSTGIFVAAPATTYDRAKAIAYHELIWFVEGSAQLEDHGKTYELPPNSVVLNRPGIQCHYSWDANFPTRMGLIVFSTTASEDFPLLRHLSADDLILSLLNHVVWLRDARPTGWQDQASEALSYALHAFRTGASATTPSISARGLPVPIERSMALVRSRWSGGNPLLTPSLDDLADAAGVSREYLCRVYKKELGYGPIAALRLLRLRHTAGLLARTNMTVKQIAHEAGFENQFHFARAFKQAFGITPTQFRRTDVMNVPLPNAIRRLGMYY